MTRRGPISLALLGLVALIGVFDRATAAAAPFAARGQTGRAKIVLSLHAELERHHPGMADHTQRVATSAGKIARALRLPFTQTRATEVAALLHDIGKIDVGIATLDGAKQVSVQDQVALRLHPTTGLARFGTRFPQGRLARYVSGGIAAHHERWDGGGYPLGLSGEAIPLSARIIAVADTYDAMTSARGYNRPYSHQEAVNALRKAAGSQLDARVVRAFLSTFAVQQDGRAVE